MRVNEGFAALIPLTLALSGEGRGERIYVKAFNAFVLVSSIAADYPERGGQSISKDLPI